METNPLIGFLRTIMLFLAGRIKVNYYTSTFKTALQSAAQDFGRLSQSMGA